MTVVCITGMHRSGTSLVTRMLNLCGLYLGEEKDLMPPTLDNPAGYWENFHFVNLNDKLLADLNGGRDLPPVTETGWENWETMASHHTEAEQLIDDMRSRITWGWKDPRNSLTMPFWQKLIPNLKVVVCLRNPFEVAQSLSKRGYSSLFGMQLWYLYNKQLLANIPEKDFIVTHFDTYFLDPRAELGRIASFLKLSIDDQGMDWACEAINLSLKHHNSPFPDLSYFKAYPKSGEMYLNLCALAGPVYQLSHQKYSRNSFDSPEVSNKEATEAEEIQIKEKLIESLLNRLVRNIHIIQSLELQLKEKGRSVHALQALMAHLSGIESSKTLNIGLIFRRIRILIAPPGSRRENALLGLYKHNSILVNRVNPYRSLAEDLNLVRSSGLFDEAWYLSHNPDVAEAKIDPLRHYLLFGGVERRIRARDFVADGTWIIMKT